VNLSEIDLERVDLNWYYPQNRQQNIAVIIYVAENFLIVLEI
jgi:hypothetical protein